MTLQDKEIGDALLNWAEDSGRNPPWRRVSDLYLLAVAELLLQKTKATDVEPVWTELTSRFPTVASLARARDDDIRKVIEVLGLGRQRTERLKAMATAMMSSCEIDALPGLGPYGSAVVSLSAGAEPRNVPVDGNIARVVCRYQGLRFERGEPRKKRQVREAVENFLSGEEDSARKLRLVYALVDLGEGVCRRKPTCPVCPLARTCSFALTERIG